MLQPADVRCWTEKSYINIYATPMRNKLVMLITITISIIIIVIMEGGGLSPVFGGLPVRQPASKRENYCLL